MVLENVKLVLEDIYSNLYFCNEKKIVLLNDNFLSNFTFEDDQNPLQLNAGGNAEFLTKVSCDFDKALKRMVKLEQYKFPGSDIIPYAKILKRYKIKYLTPCNHFQCGSGIQKVSVD